MSFRVLKHDPSQITQALAEKAESWGQAAWEQVEDLRMGAVQPISDEERNLRRLLLMDHRSPETVTQFELSTSIIAPTYQCNLNCRYCYRRDLERRFPRDMSLGDYEQVLEWLSRSGKVGVRFQGGEPTVHPHFPEMLRMSRDAGMKVVLCTNGAFSKKVCLALMGEGIEYMWVNFSAWLSASFSIRRRIERNIVAVRSQGIKVMLAYVIDGRGQGEEALLRMARRYDLELVHACYPVPGYEESITAEELMARLEPLTMRMRWLVQEGWRHGVLVFIYRIVPRCALDEKQERELLDIHPHLFQSRCILGFGDDWAFRAVINPDLTTFPCAVCFIPGPSISSLSGYNELSNFYRPRLRPLTEMPMASRCLGCPHHEAAKNQAPTDDPQTFFNRDICQGGCINYHELIAKRGR